MLRNATRELERRRRMPRQVFLEALIFRQLLSQGCSRRAFASQVAVGSRHDNVGIPGVEHHEALANQLSLRRGGSQTVATRRLRRHMLLSVHSGRSGSLDDRATPWRDAPDTRTPDRRRRHELDMVTEVHRGIFTKEAVSQDEEKPVAVDGPWRGPRWSGNQYRRRPVERRTNLVKSWTRHTPNLLLKRVLDSNDDVYRWKRQAAITRSMRLPVILLQMHIRKEASQLPDQKALLDLLPHAQEWGTMMSVMRRNGHSLEDLDHYLYILEGETDDVRRQRFLERDSYKPIFILNFLLRGSSVFSKIESLGSIIEYCRNLSKDSARYEKGESKTGHSTSKMPPRPKWAINPIDFDYIMALLAHHCIRLEPRLMVKLAEVAAEYMKGIAASQTAPDDIYRIQCLVFNSSLELFQPQPRLRVAQMSLPNAFFWEAQRILLAMSAGLERPLLVDQGGFRAIRSVLGSLPKNQTEIHSSARHAAMWPPYLQPGDGMDEATDPEDNWSRAVRAGMLMQEAGFDKEERDDALDILQGMAPDGTPTIQQRTSIAKSRILSTWEASIRATRNAQEAWQRFRNPPEAGLKPGVAQYAAMFEKLVLREADANTRALPGDKALNFPTQQEANLAEFERARRQPPSVAELYRRMLLGGIRPMGHCLRILVANAGSLDTANRYLMDSAEDDRVIRALISHDPDPQSLKKIDMRLFSAYIRVLARQEGRQAARHMMRAIRMAGSRVKSARSPWVQFVWGSILKNLSQHHYALRISLDEQLTLFFDILEQISGTMSLPLSTFVQFSKCVRKVTMRELNQLSADSISGQTVAAAECSSLWSLYDRQFRSREGTHRGSLDESETQSPLPLLRKAAARMKEWFDSLTSQEKEIQRLLGSHQVAVAALDRMAWRIDPVRSEHAYEYMLSLAYLGEFQEMARVLRWLISEWGQADVVEALLELDEPPAYADPLETLCAFRLLAEPMLDKGEVESLQEAIGAAKLNWAWPDDEAVEAYAAKQDDESIASLARVLEGIRMRGRRTDAT